MTIFVWFLLVLFVLWLLTAVVGIVSILMEPTYSRALYYARTGRLRTGELHVGRALFHTVVPFIGIGACIGYLFG